MTNEYNIVSGDTMCSYELSDDTIFNFEVGCGDRIITLGEDYSAILNFISDTREGYVSQYQISENITENSATITRITGTPSTTRFPNKRKRESNFQRIRGIFRQQFCNSRRQL